MIQTGIAAGYRWNVEFYSLKDQSHIEVRVFAPRLLRHQTVKFPHPLNSISPQWELSPRCSTAHTNMVYVFEDAVKSLRTPVDGWFEVEYASRSIVTIPRLATAENSEWRVSSGLWYSPWGGRQVQTTWQQAYENMQPAAEHVCRELRKVEEAEC